MSDVNTEVARQLLERINALPTDEERCKALEEWLRTANAYVIELLNNRNIEMRQAYEAKDAEQVKEIMRLRALVENKIAYNEALRRALNSKTAALKQAGQLLDMQDREICCLLGQLEKAAP